MRADDPYPASTPEGRSSDIVGTTTGASVAGAGFWHLAAKVMPQLYVLIISITAARILGPDGMGQQSFISFVQISVVLLFTGGLSKAMMRYTAELVGQGSTDVVRGLLRWGWRILSLGALAAVILLATMGLLRDQLQAAWLLAALVGGVAVLHSVPHAVLTGLQRWRSASVVSLSTGGAGALGTLLVLHAGYGITGMFAVELVVTTVNLLWVGRLVRRTVVAQSATISPPDAALRGRVRSYAAGVWLHLALSLVVWRRSELFILDWTSTDAQIAMYSVAFATLGAARQIPGALAEPMTPAVANLLGAGEMERISRGFSRGARLLMILVLPMTAGLLAIGPQLVQAAFGEEYRDAGVPLLILTAIFPLLPLSSLCAGVLHGLGRIRPILVATAVATAVNLVLAFSLIPGRGAIGAAIANSAAQMTAATLMLAATLRTLSGVSLRLRSILSAAVASLLCGLVAFAIGQNVAGLGGLLLAIACGILTFGIAATGLRIVPADDAAWLDEALGARFGGSLGRVIRLMSPREHAAEDDVPGRAEDR
jgi:O-antigen/teichoic acid export membrane protein